MNEWLNTERIIYEDTEKPRHKLGWCPYGALIEEFPFGGAIVDIEDNMVRARPLRCKVFGHDCPVFYLREDLSEGVSKDEKRNGKIDCLE